MCHILRFLDVWHMCSYPKRMVKTSYQLKPKKHQFWSPEHKQAVISSTATFDEIVFSHCSRKSDDKPPPIPQDNKDEVNQEPLQDPKSQQDILVTQYYSFLPMRD